jgi:uncharacterized protein YbjT (DUF2867 family)
LLPETRSFVANFDPSTGATGYVGGQVLHALQQSNSRYDISVLVRDAQKASKVSAAHPQVCIVLADLDNSSVIEDEARKANIVIRELPVYWYSQLISNYIPADAASNKHMESVKAIAKGLAGRKDGTCPIVHADFNAYF